MSFWIYENWTHEKAVIHQSTCSYCKDGRGLHGTAGNGNDRWHGPYSLKEAALTVAKNTGREIIKDCPFCSTE